MYQTQPLNNYGKLKFLIQYISATGGTIAGGCFKNIFNNEPLKDIDIFFSNEKKAIGAFDVFRLDVDRYVPIYANDRVKSFRDKKNNLKIDLVMKYFYPNPQDLLSSFDFTITKFAMYNKKILEEDGNFHYEPFITFHKNYFEHLHLKRLVIDDKIPFPASTFERLIKYVSYGYMPCRDTKIALIEALRTLPADFTVSNSLYDGID